MSVSYFVFFVTPSAAETRVAGAEIDALCDVLRTVRGLVEGLVFTPAPADTKHPFPDDGPPPPLALQLRFRTLPDLEATLRRDGDLQRVAEAGLLRSLAGAAVTQQAMMTRSFAVADPGAAAPDRPRCSYLVHYPGAAEDLNAWLAHYVDHHPAIMARFPGVREIEIYTRVDWIDAMPWTRVAHMQRNKLVFDSPQALSAALLSPVIREMRADFHSFPRFTGGNLHYPMMTRVVSPAAPP